MDKMDWDDIRVFLAIARAGTLGAAAKEAGQTQPTMGRRLRGLEASVGHNLFQRTAEGFVLTEEGTALLLHAERMEQEALSIDRLLTGQAMGITGTLRISSSDWFGAHVLTKIFSEFLAQHPQVSIELVTDSRLFSLTRREADLAFRITPFKEADIIQRKLMHMNYALYGPAGCVHPSAADGQGHAVITMDSAFSKLPDVTWLQRMLPNARALFGSNNREVQARMCAHGAGLAVLPCPLGDQTAGIERIDLGEAPPGRDVWFGYHRDLRRLARLRELLNLLVSRLSNL
jgi:DNA-binding transcriptional LysR family regulator